MADQEITGTAADTSQSQSPPETNDDELTVEVLQDDGGFAVNSDGEFINEFGEVVDAGIDYNDPRFGPVDDDQAQAQPAASEAPPIVAPPPEPTEEQRQAELNAQYQANLRALTSPARLQELKDNDQLDEYIEAKLSSKMACERNVTFQAGALANSIPALFGKYHADFNQVAATLTPENAMLPDIAAAVLENAILRKAKVTGNWEDMSAYVAFRQGKRSTPREAEAHIPGNVTTVRRGSAPSPAQSSPRRKSYGEAGGLSGLTAAQRAELLVTLKSEGR